MVVTSEEQLKVGDLVRIVKAQHCVGLVVETSDKWTRDNVHMPDNVHHARVFWTSGDYVVDNQPSATWMSVRELEIVSRGGNKELDND
jgi:hypothetical protein